MVRHVVKEPDPNTARGQLALWIKFKLPADMTAKDLAERVNGSTKQTGYNWLNGHVSPPMSEWGSVASVLGLGKDWIDLVPPEKFVRYVRRHKRLPSKR